MQRDLGKATRKIFSARLGAMASGFGPAPEFALPGATWPFVRRASTMMQAVTYQQHKHEDSFTVEVSWSVSFDDPVRPPMGAPDDPFEPAGRRFRLAAFWEPMGDFWWQVGDGPPDPLALSQEAYLEALAYPKPVDMAEQAPRIEAAVDDAVSRLVRHALPYFARVTEWARGRSE